MRYWPTCKKQFFSAVDKTLNMSFDTELSSLLPQRRKQNGTHRGQNKKLPREQGKEQILSYKNCIISKTC